MSTRRQLRAAELAVLEQAEKIADAIDFDGPVEADEFEMHIRVGLLRSAREALAVPAHNDADTSANAARSMIPRAGSIRHQILVAIYRENLAGRPGLTDAGLEYRLRGKHQTVSAARNHLYETGWLHPSGQHTKNPQTGREQIIWALTEHARTEVPKSLTPGVV